jgi:hypothetical protein
VAVEHRQEALGISRVAGFDDEIEDQAFPCGEHRSGGAIWRV